MAGDSSDGAVQPRLWIAPALPCIDVLPLGTLRPAVSEPALRRAFESVVTGTREDILKDLARVHDEALPLLKKHTTHLDAAGSGAPGSKDSVPTLHVDWASARGTAAGIDTAHARPRTGMSTHSARKCRSPCFPR